MTHVSHGRDWLSGVNKQCKKQRVIETWLINSVSMCHFFFICGIKALPHPHVTPSLRWSRDTCCLVTCSTSIKINSANRLWHCLSCVLQNKNPNPPPQQQLASSSLAGSREATVQQFLFWPHFKPQWPGSNEVFLLFAWGLVRQVLVWVLAGGQFPRRPVGSLVVTEIPVQQEGQNGYRQHNDDNHHWKTHTRETDGNSTRLCMMNPARGERERERELPATTAGSEVVGTAVVAAKRGKKCFFFIDWMYCVHSK